MTRKYKREIKEQVKSGKTLSSNIKVDKPKGKKTDV